MTNPTRLSRDYRTALAARVVVALLTGRQHELAAAEAGLWPCRFGCATER